MGSSSSPWATLRTAIAIAGLGFAIASLGVACLDYAGDDFGVCDTTTASTAEAGVVGSGSVVIPATTTEADCGVVTPLPSPTIGSGTGSAAP